MAKKLNLIDEKMTKVISILAQASEEIHGWADDAATCIQQINTAINQINEDVQHERITTEDAVVSVEENCAKPSRKLYGRIKRMTKNAKAMNSLLGALKAMQDEEEK